MITGNLSCSLYVRNCIGVIWGNLPPLGWWQETWFLDNPLHVRTDPQLWVLDSRQVRVKDRMEGGRRMVFVVVKIELVVNLGKIWNLCACCISDWLSMSMCKQ